MKNRYPLHAPWIAALWLLTLVLLAGRAMATVPSTVSYQGYLTDTVGTALDGSYSIQFSIYNVDTGGLQLWSDTQTVTVNQGLLSVQLGGSGAPFPVGLFDTPLWLGINVETDGEMSPRQPFDTVAFSFKADDALSLEGQSAATLDQSAHVGDFNNPHAVTAAQTGALSGAELTTHAGEATAHHTRYADGEAVDAIKATDGAGSGLDADLLDGNDSENFAVSGHDHGTVYYTKAEVNSLVGGLQAQVVALQTLLQHFSRVGNNVLITGANLYLRSGSGSTDGAVNGLGNLIVGYNELREDGTDDRSGSHNLVVGRKQNFGSYGGLVAGELNTLGAAYASVSGGGSNTASGFRASISGGFGNNAIGSNASVSGGRDNIASGETSSISGGEVNVASARSASVTGGTENEANDSYTSVSGGFDNTASNNYASISGGQGNTASGSRSSVSGGQSNTASGPWASVGGGKSNTASADNASVSGGELNEAMGTESSVSGGYDNTASGNNASISGGQRNIASAGNASVSGGDRNEAIGAESSVSGGYHNIAVGIYASVSGGRDNTAEAYRSSVTGGRGNTASGSDSSVTGGQHNVASGDFAVVVGGGGATETDGNEAFAHYSAILGGNLNWAGDHPDYSPSNRTVGERSTISGGVNNVTQGIATSISGGEDNETRGIASSISGGYNNLTGGGNPVPQWASVCGGEGNVAAGDAGTICGGQDNHTTGDWATVTGGEGNWEHGNHSIITGGWGVSSINPHNWKGADCYYCFDPDP